ncbi:MAG: hypothetical protein V1717_03195, partial [Candidatus Micrarchaeota archaeon]
MVVPVWVKTLQGRFREASRVGRKSRPLILKAGLPIAVALTLLALAPPLVRIAEPPPRMVSRQAKEVPAQVWIQGSKVAEVNAIIGGLNEHAPLGTVYYREGDQIKMFKITAMPGPPTDFSKLLTSEQQFRLAEIVQRANERRAMEVYRTEAARYFRGEELEKRVPVVREPVDVNYSNLIFNLMENLKPEDVRAINQILGEVPAEKKAKYADLFYEDPVAKKRVSLSTGAIVGLSILGVAGLLAGREALKGRVSDKALEKGAEKLSQSGVKPTARRLLEHHVGRTYAGLLSLGALVSRRQDEVSLRIEPHLNSAAQARADEVLSQATAKEFKRAAPL